MAQHGNKAVFQVQMDDAVCVQVLTPEGAKSASIDDDDGACNLPAEGCLEAAQQNICMLHFLFHAQQSTAASVN